MLSVGVIAVQASDYGNYPSVIEKIAERFSVSVDEVKEVIDEARQERHQEMVNRFEGRLDNLVANNQLTEVQKEALLEKMSEMRQAFGELKDLSPEEKKAEMQTINEEMKTWAEENDIQLGFLKGFNKGFGKGFGMKGLRHGF